MIRLCGGRPPFGENIGDITAQKAACLYGIYGGDASLFLCWYQMIDGKVTAVMFTFGGALTVSCTVGAESGEIFDFVKFLGYTEFYCTGASARILGVKPQTERKIMRFSGRQALVKDIFCSSATLDEIYSLLKSGADGEIELPPREYFFTDISHRMRRGAARVKYRSGAIALTSVENSGFALIGAVCTAPRERGKGLGRAVLSAITNELAGENRDVFTVAGKGAAEFYKKCGFTEADTYCIVKIGNG